MLKNELLKPQYTLTTFFWIAITSTAYFSLITIFSILLYPILPGVVLGVAIFIIQAMVYLYFYGENNYPHTTLAYYLNLLFALWSLFSIAIIIHRIENYHELKTAKIYRYANLKKPQDWRNYNILYFKESAYIHQDYLGKHHYTTNTRNTKNNTITYTDHYIYIAPIVPKNWQPEEPIHLLAMCTYHNCYKKEFKNFSGKIKLNQIYRGEKSVSKHINRTLIEVRLLSSGARKKSIKIADNAWIGNLLQKDFQIQTAIENADKRRFTTFFQAIAIWWAIIILFATGFFLAER